MKEDLTILSARWCSIGYDNFYYPFQDEFRNDRIIAYNHKTKNKIEIYNNPYPLKYNDQTGRLCRITDDEFKLILETKEKLNWDTKMQLDYPTSKSERSIGLGERDYGFYRKDINMLRVNAILKDVISFLSFEEICKMFREICYDQISYYNDDLKGHIYNGEYDKQQIEQATFLQRKVSTAIDLYSQSIVNKNTFNEDYLRERLGL